MRGESRTHVRRSAQGALLIAPAASVVALVSVALAGGEAVHARGGQAAARGASTTATGGATVRAFRNAAVGRVIVVDARGRTLYRLSPETPRHLLCTRSCLRSWSPLTVASRRSKLVAAPGVAGRLATVHRPDGRLQVTLRGFPLYRFSGDRSAGQAYGRGLQSFGGVWQVVLARAAKLPPQPPPITHVGSQPPGPSPVGPKLPPNPPPI